MLAAVYTLARDRFLEKPSARKDILPKVCPLLPEFGAFLFGAQFGFTS